MTRIQKTFMGHHGLNNTSTIGAIICLIFLVPSVFMVVAGSTKEWACKSGKPIDLQTWLLAYGCMLTAWFGLGAVALTGNGIGGNIGTGVMSVFGIIFKLSFIVAFILFQFMWTIIGIVELSTTKKDKCSEVVYNTSIAATVFGSLVFVLFFSGIAKIRFF